MLQYQRLSLESQTMNIVCFVIFIGEGSVFRRTLVIRFGNI